MDTSIEALAVFAYLMPGFLSGLVLNRLVDRRQVDNMRQCVEALLFSFITYSILSVLMGDSPVEIITPAREGAHPITVFNPDMVLPTLGMSLLLPVIVSICIHNDIPNKWLREHGITKSTSQQTVWAQALAGEPQCYVTVRMKNGDVFYGWPTYYSASEDKPGLYLTNPYHVLPDKTFVRIRADAIMILDGEDIYYMEFHPQQQVAGDAHDKTAE